MKKILSIMLTLFIPTLSLTAKGTNPSHGGRGASTYTNPASTEYAGSAKYHIGDYAEGGVIIWLTSDGQHGLVSAITDVPGGLYQWSPNGAHNQTDSTQNNPMPLTVGSPPYNSFSGYYDTHNTIEYYATSTSPYAAQVAANFTFTDPTTGITYADWFLPSDAELNLMYCNKLWINKVVGTVQGATALREDYYWSSREYDGDFAWILSFADGTQAGGAKGLTVAVRCVRAF